MAAVVVLMSPAKTLNWEAAPGSLTIRHPPLLRAADAPLTIVKSMNAAALGKALGISAALASLNAERYAAFLPSAAAEAVGPSSASAQARFCGATSYPFAPRVLEHSLTSIHTDYTASLVMPHPKSASSSGRPRLPTRAPRSLPWTHAPSRRRSSSGRSPASACLADCTARWGRPTASRFVSFS